MSGPVTVTLNDRQRLVTLNLLTTKIDGLRSLRTRRMRYGIGVERIDGEIADLRDLRCKLAPPRPDSSEAPDLAPRIAQLRAML